MLIRYFQHLFTWRSTFSDDKNNMDYISNIFEGGFVREAST